MGRFLISCVIAAIIALGIVLALKYFQLPFDNSWVLGTAGIIAILLWIIIRKK